MRHDSSPFCSACSRIFQVSSVIEGIPRLTAPVERSNTSVTTMAARVSQANTAMETRSASRARRHACKRPSPEGDGLKRKLSREDFNCPICLEIWKEVYVTSCGHSFCYPCIMRALKQARQCPLCKTSLPVESAVRPNYSLNDVVAKYRQHARAEPELARHAPSVDEILRLSTRVDLQRLLTALQQQMSEQEEQEKVHESTVLVDFLHRARHCKKQELETIQKQLAVLEEDCSTAEAKMAAGGEQTVPSIHSPSQEPSSSEASSSQQVTPDPVTPADLAAAEKLDKKKLRVHSNFDELLQNYLEASSGPVEDPADRLEEFSVSLRSFIRLSSFRELSAMTYQSPSSCSIVSDIEFDRDGEFFAIAGFTGKIKVFNYHSVLRNVGFTNHFPVQEMSCNAKLGSVCYNPYHKSTLASGDFKGCVSVWDTNTGLTTESYQEHSKRVWSVVYSPTDPTIFASGSEDCTVKLWCPSRQQHSISTLPTSSVVSSVKFHPTDSRYLAYGSADRFIYYMDLRKPNAPLRVLRGNLQGVSYIHFISPTELVSASISSELKLWNTELAQCVRTYRGHTNNKTFTGLTVSPNYIACGSENNAFYVYSKAVSKPMLEYKFRNILPDSSGGSDGQQRVDFVSSICFKKNTNILLAGNSQGHVKVLELL